MKAYGWRIVLAGVLALMGLAVGWGIVASRSLPAVTAAPASGTPEAAHLEFQEDPGALALASFDSPSPTCYRPVAGSGSCYIQWSYILVAANSPNYIISTTLSIDGHLRAYHSGFFQTSMYIPGELYGPGFRVTCGFPAGDGSTGLGNTYNYTLRARETGGNVATNSGSVQCPADVVRVSLPLVQRQ